VASQSVCAQVVQLSVGGAPPPGGAGGGCAIGAPADVLPRAGPLAFVFALGVGVVRRRGRR